MSDAAGLGDHGLPSRFSGADAVPPRRRGRRRTGLVLGLLAGIAVVAALAAVQVGASLGYDDAEAAFDDAARSAITTSTQVRGANDQLKAAADIADLILESDSGTLVDAATGDSLAVALTDAEAVASAADGAVAEEVPSAGEKPLWFWELFPASGRLDAERAQVIRLEQDLENASDSIAASGDEVDEAGVALLATASASAAGFESAHLSAGNDEVIALRDAAAVVSSATVLDQAAADSFLTLETAAAQVLASEQAELAEKAGPLERVRLEIETFARSLAPGVLLEFDWNRIVNGAGENGSMGGLTTWWWDEPDRALIELSDSVAEQWPSIRSKSLVAHEVGHAISVKCEDLYDSSTQDSIEKWATAWAISMGFTDDANGVWAYGYPPQSYIDAANGCR
ncbi:hypothetical protein [Microbacterium sp. SD291]|uniref:hypothetical protein n=1 Tax=Microbacterium sp. SD291 TaxID=2782007 RepID=UPI001A969636|nr:hypothetical protein [Microbacterium sp. SD291]